MTATHPVRSYTVVSTVFMRRCSFAACAFSALPTNLFMGAPPTVVLLVRPAAQRLPQDFEPFFAVDRRTRRLDDDSTSSVSTTQDRTARRIGARVKGLAFRLLFTVFSSRHWDRLYLLLGLSWSILCPGYMDGAIAVERGQLASLLLVMFVAAGAPALLAFILKVFFSIRLRSRLLHDDRGRFVVRKEKEHLAANPFEC